MSHDYNVFRIMNHRAALLERRALVEDTLAAARTVGDVWRLNDQLADIEQHLADGPPPARPRQPPPPLDEATLERLRAAVGLPDCANTDQARRSTQCGTTP